MVTLRRGFVYVPPANEAPQHDLDGNLTDDGRWVYTWDAENRLTSMTQKVIPVAAGVSTPPERTRLEFAYDYKNRRIAKKVFQLETSNMAPATWRLVKDLRFVYNGWHMIAELDATFATGTGVAGITPTRGVVRTYLWGPDVSGTMTGAGGVGGLLAFTFQGDSYYPISDANGNIAAIHAPGINQVIRFDYDPFGNRITNTGPDVEICPMGFSTKYTDSETGLVDYGLRIYTPMMARWLSRDPIGESGGINLYGMVGNDPVNKWDYLGMDFIAVGDRAVKGVGWLNLNHYSVSYWESECDPKIDEEIKVADIAKKFPGARKKESVELLNHDSYKAKQIAKTIFGRDDWDNIGISVIHFSDAATTIKSIYNGGPNYVLQKWDAIERAARNYQYAEQDGSVDAFLRWPNSLYEISDSGNNSNTFVRFVVGEAGLTMKEMSGFHPGANSPHAITNIYDGLPVKR